MWRWASRPPQGAAYGGPVTHVDLSLPYAHDLGARFCIVSMEERRHSGMSHMFTDGGEGAYGFTRDS